MTNFGTILITGGSGFLGKALARKLRGRAEVVLAGRNQGRNQIAARYTGCRVLPMDVASIESVRDVVNEVRPALVIHAAASKFVDVSERSPMECVDVNVIGSENVLRVCIDRGVGTLVGISTDKAAPPAGNIYGLSKALMERMFCSMHGRTGLRTSCVRFGNIAWSTGSVFPIWRRMQERDGVIRSTGPHMRRFFFTVDDAADLVLRATERLDDVQGRVLSMRMKAAQVSDLLDVWKECRGATWEKIDPRPGDKIDEYLIGPSEAEHATSLTIDGVEHYLLDFARPAANALTEPLSSQNAERMTREEMRHLIEAMPEEDAL